MADDNGVAVLSAEEAETLLPKCQGVEAREAVWRQEHEASSAARRSP